MGNVGGFFLLLNLYCLICLLCQLNPISRPLGYLLWACVCCIMVKLNVVKEDLHNELMYQVKHSNMSVFLHV